MDKVPSEVDLLSDEELIQKVFDRFIHCVFSGIKIGCSDGDVITQEWQGEEIYCKGLSCGLAQHIERECIPDEEEEEDLLE